MKRSTEAEEAFLPHEHITSETCIREKSKTTITFSFRNLDGLDASSVRMFVGAASGKPMKTILSAEVSANGVKWRLRLHPDGDGDKPFKRNYRLLVMLNLPPLFQCHLSSPC